MPESFGEQRRKRVDRHVRQEFAGGAGLIAFRLAIIALLAWGGVWAIDSPRALWIGGIVALALFLGWVWACVGRA